MLLSSLEYNSTPSTLHTIISLFLLSRVHTFLYLLSFLLVLSALICLSPYRHDAMCAQLLFLYTNLFRHPIYYKPFAFNYVIDLLYESRNL